MRLILAFVVMLLAGCAAKTIVTDKAAAIHVHSQMSTLLADCKKIGPVTGTAKASLVDYDELGLRAKINAREKAADMGADTLVVTNIDYLESPSSAIVQGVAMRCN